MSQVANEFEQALKSIRLGVQLVWGALFASIFILVGVRFLIVQSVKSTVLDPQIEQILTLAAAAAALGSVFFPRLLFNERRLFNAIESSPASSAAPEGLSREEQLLLRALPRYVPKTLVGMALAESVVIIGLVLSISAGDPLKIIPFGATSLLLALYHFPRLNREELERLKRLAAQQMDRA